MHYPTPVRRVPGPPPFGQGIASFGFVSVSTENWYEAEIKHTRTSVGGISLLLWWPNSTLAFSVLRGGPSDSSWGRAQLQGYCSRELTSRPCLLLSGAGRAG